MIFQFHWRRIFSVSLLAGLTAILVEIPLQAELLWDSETGYRLHRENLDDRELRRADMITARMTYARRQHERGRLGEALRFYREVYRGYPHTVYAPEALFQAARVRVDRRQWSKAFDELQRIVENYPDYAHFHQVIKDQFSIAHALDAGARHRILRIIPGFRNRHRAVEYYEQIVENAPFSDQAPLALLNAARIQIDRRKHEEAIDLYDRFISEYPRHPQAPDAYIGLATAFSSRVRGPAYDQGATRESIGYFEDFTILHSAHPRVDEAEEGITEMSDKLAQSRLVIGDFYFRWRSNYHAARVFYNEAITIAPGSPSAEEAREKLAEIDRREAR